MVQNQNPAGGKSLRGFASMDPERQRQIASEGGRAAHRLGTAHEFTPEEARAAGRKGGERVSQNRAHMAEIGRRGGEASGGGRSSRVRHTSDTRSIRDGLAPDLRVGEHQPQEQGAMSPSQD